MAPVAPSGGFGRKLGGSFRESFFCQNCQGGLWSSPTNPHNFGILKIEDFGETRCAKRSMQGYMTMISNASAYFVAVAFEAVSLQVEKYRESPFGRSYSSSSRDL